jgi:DNA-binding transcriptional LysR family regulator
LLGTVDFAFMAAPSLDLPKSTLTAPDLANWPLISLGPNAVLSQVEEQWFQAGRATARKQDRSNSMEISAGLVRSGLGVSFLPIFYYAEDIKAGRMRILDVDPCPPSISFFCVHRSANVTPIIRKVIDIAMGLDGFSGAAPSSVRDI